MQWAVSWNTIGCPSITRWMNHFSTNIVSDFVKTNGNNPNFEEVYLQHFKPIDIVDQNPVFVTLKNLFVNQQVTNGFVFLRKNNLVETPEAVCPPETKMKYNTNPESINHSSDHHWREWLAGFIDGDGCFLVSKKGYASLEITVHTKDYLLLQDIKQHYGGSVKPRTGSDSVRYRLHNKKGLYKLCHHVNGFLRHHVRIQQFQKVCNCFHIVLKSSDCLSTEHGWFVGLFDADGCITLNHHKYPVITISVSQKFQYIPNFFFEYFKGSIYFDKNQNGCWIWAVQSKEDVLKITNFLQTFPRRSSRRNRLMLVPEFYGLRARKAHLKKTIKTKPLLYKEWLEFLNKWQNASC